MELRSKWSINSQRYCNKSSTVLKLYSSENCTTHQNVTEYILILYLEKSIPNMEIVTSNQRNE